MSSGDIDPESSSLSQKRAEINDQLNEITKLLQEQAVQTRACLEKMKEEAEKARRRQEEPDVYRELSKGFDVMKKLHDNFKEPDQDQASLLGALKDIQRKNENMIETMEGVAEDCNAHHKEVIAAIKNRNKA